MLVVSSRSEIGNDVSSVGDEALQYTQFFGIERACHGQDYDLVRFEAVCGQRLRGYKVIGISQVAQCLRESGLGVGGVATKGFLDLVKVRAGRLS